MLLPLKKKKNVACLARFIPQCPSPCASRHPVRGSSARCHCFCALRSRWLTSGPVVCWPFVWPATAQLFLPFDLCVSVTRVVHIPPAPWRPALVGRLGPGVVPFGLPAFDLGTFVLEILLFLPRLLGSWWSDVEPAEEKQRGSVLRLLSSAQSSQ